MHKPFMNIDTFLYWVFKVFYRFRKDNVWHVRPFYIFQGFFNYSKIIQFRPQTLFQKFGTTISVPTPQVGRKCIVQTIEILPLQFHTIFNSILGMCSSHVMFWDSLLTHLSYLAPTLVTNLRPRLEHKVVLLHDKCIHVN